MTVLADPSFISWEEWANIAVIELPDDQLPSPPSEESWQFWATEALKQGAFLDACVPDPRAYPRWQDWAEIARRLVQ